LTVLSEAILSCLNPPLVRLEPGASTLLIRLIQVAFAAPVQVGHDSRMIASQRPAYRLQLPAQSPEVYCSAVYLLYGLRYLIVVYPPQPINRRPS